MNEITFKGLSINEDEKLCSIDKEDAGLSKSEYLLITFLLKNRNKIFSSSYRF